MIKVVAALLIFLEPLRFAAEALAVIPTIGYRGWLATAELVAHGVVAALSASAGFALFNNSPDGRRLGRMAIVVAAARSIQSMTWSVLPNNAPPGSELLSIGATVTVATIAFVVLQVAAPVAGRS